MTPLVFVVGFCLAMAAIAFGRVAFTANRTPNDIAVALFTSGIAALTGAWVSLDLSWLRTFQRVAIVVCGVLLIGFGLLVLQYGWGSTNSCRNESSGCKNRQETNRKL